VVAVAYSYPDGDGVGGHGRETGLGSGFFV
jgi:hypothetical protein